MTGKRLLRKALQFILPYNPLGDRIYATIDFVYMHRRFPRFHKPATFNDHLFRLRVGPEAADGLRCTVADKILVKNFIGRIVGKRYTLETIAILESNHDVDRFKPAIPCVIKPAHMSGHVSIVRSTEEKLDRERMKQWLRTDYYRNHRERPYKGMQKRVLVEEFFTEDGATPPDDFKVFCFGGAPKFIQVDQGRFNNHTRTIFTSDWRKLPISYEYSQGKDIPRPIFLEELLEICGQLAEPFTFIRVDALSVNGKLKINELTNCPEAARGRFSPDGTDEKLGQLFTYPHKLPLELLNIKETGGEQRRNAVA